MTAPEYDAVVVGAGPNGLTAAAVIARTGRKVLVLEAADQLGGGTRSLELTEPGFVHDVCSAIHPLGVTSPVLRDLDLEGHGVEWIHPDAPVAHALDGRVAVLERSIEATAAGFGVDGDAWRKLVGPTVHGGQPLIDSLLSPLSIPRAPIALARYGLQGIRGAKSLTRRFETDEAKGLFAGLAAHSMLELDAPVTGGYGLMFAAVAHLAGWPMAKGGSQSIADALAATVTEHGGEIITGHRVESLAAVPSNKAVLLDVTPRQLVAMAGDRLPPRYRRRLERFRLGPGVFKLDWALDGPIPWADPAAARAATVHLGGSFEEVAAAEHEVIMGRHPERPFTLVVQSSLFDPTRAPAGKHTGWAYCHVPNGSSVDMTEAIERQVERFAPGFRDLIRTRSVMDSAAMHAHNPNYIGGDISGGAADLRQFVARPNLSLHPWQTPLDGVYLCSASTPPGAGVHGMCGWHAATRALRHM